MRAELSAHRHAHGETSLPKPNYSFEKRQRELAKKKKQEEKRQKKAARTDDGAPPADEAADSTAPAPADSSATPAP